MVRFASTHAIEEILTICARRANARPTARNARSRAGFVRSGAVVREAHFEELGGDLATHRRAAREWKSDEWLGRERAQDERGIVVTQRHRRYEPDAHPGPHGFTASTPAISNATRIGAAPCANARPTSCRTADPASRSTSGWAASASSVTPAAYSGAASGWPVGTIATISSRATRALRCPAAVFRRAALRSLRDIERRQRCDHVGRCRSFVWIATARARLERRDQVRQQVTRGRRVRADAQRAGLAAYRVTKRTCLREGVALRLRVLQRAVRRPGSGGYRGLRAGTAARRIRPAAAATGPTRPAATDATAAWLMFRCSATAANVIS